MPRRSARTPPNGCPGTTRRPSRKSTPAPTRPPSRYARWPTALRILAGSTQSVHEIAPVFLKNPGRIEALFTLYFLALLVQALIERELRLAIKREHIAQLPIYPEQRQCKRPTTEQILRLFSLAERHTPSHALLAPCRSSTPNSRPCSVSLSICSAWLCRPSRPEESPEIYAKSRPRCAESPTC